MLNFEGRRESSHLHKLLLWLCLVFCSKWRSNNCWSDVYSIFQFMIKFYRFFETTFDLLYLSGILHPPYQNFLKIPTHGRSDVKFKCIIKYFIGRETVWMIGLLKTNHENKIYIPCVSKNWLIPINWYYNIWYK